MSKIVLLLLIVVLATVFAYPANLVAEEQETPLSRMAREANPKPGHFGGFGGYKFGGFGGYHGYGGGYPSGYGGYPSGHGGYGGYRPHFGYGGGGQSHSSAQSGAISSPFGSASFASAKAGSSGYGR